jgi:periplasmic protein TonB
MREAVMLGYAIRSPATRRKLSPTTLALIVAGHAALIFAVINARMDVLLRPYDPPILVDPIEIPKDPPPNTSPPGSATNPQTTSPIPLNHPIEIVPTPLPGPTEVNPTPSGPIGGGGIAIPDPPMPVVHIGPKLAVSENLLRPPYPEAKRRLEQEAVLRLRLEIDEQGRVRSVEPLGRADPMFLASARNHLIRHWRYAPATEGGRPVASAITITLRFKLDDI